MQNEKDSQQHSSPRTLGEILAQSLLPEGSTSTESSKSSLTTGSVAASKNQIGRPLSEAGLEKLRNIALNVSKGRLMADRELRTLLEQHFGPRIAIKRKYSPIYGKDGGYDEEFKGYEIALDNLFDSEMKLFDAVDYYNKPADHVFIAGKVAKMRLVLARRNESPEDIELLCASYMDYLAKYPTDVVNYVVEETIITKKFFPLVSEIVSRCDELVNFRKSIQRSFERCRSPLLNSPQSLINEAG